MGRKNRQRKPEPFKCCETCANMQPIGEGDHIYSWFVWERGGTGCIGHQTIKTI